MALYDGTTGGGASAAPIHPGLMRLLRTRRAGGLPGMRARPVGPRQRQGSGGGGMFDIEHLRQLIQQHLGGGGLNSPIYPGGSPNPEPHRPIDQGPPRHDYIPPGAPPLSQQQPSPLHAGMNEAPPGSGGTGMFIPGDLSGYPTSGYDVPPDPNAPLDVAQQPHGDLRESLLNRFRQATPALTSRAALMRFLQQQSPRRAAQRQGGRRPILPARPPLRAAPSRHPY